jgi:hypothetical protein
MSDTARQIFRQTMGRRPSSGCVEQSRPRSSGQVAGTLSSAAIGRSGGVRSHRVRHPGSKRCPVCPHARSAQLGPTWIDGRPEPAAYVDWRAEKEGDLRRAFLVAAVGEVASPAHASELFGGVFVHDIDSPLTIGGPEGGADFQLGWRGKPIRALGAIGSASSYTFKSLSSSHPRCAWLLCLADRDHGARERSDGL